MLQNTVQWKVGQAVSDFWLAKAVGSSLCTRHLQKGESLANPRGM